MLLCSLTNTPTENPVLSLKSKCIFDGETLETYITTNGKDPINNEPMDKTDIVPISRLSATQRMPQLEELSKPEYSSIPTMLTAFQNAWDSLSIELFQLRNELNQTKKELSLALYKQDAAVQVAVEACKERDDARYALSKLVVDGSVSNDSGGNNTNGINGKNEVDDVVLTDDWDDAVRMLKEEQSRLLQIHKTENKSRKGKSPIIPLLADSQSLKIQLYENTELLGTYGTVSKVRLNKAEAIIKYDSGNVLLINLGEQLELLNKMKSTVGSCIFWMTNKPYLISEVPRKGRKRKNDGEIKHEYQLTNLRTKEVQKINTSLNIINVESHPSLSLFVVASETEFEVFNNMTSLFIQQWDGKIKDIKFHQDGILIGLSTETGIIIYDLADRGSKLSIECAELLDFSFAANGYNIFVSNPDKIMLYDIRKNKFTMETPLADLQKNGFVFDMYTSIVISGNQYTASANGKVWSEPCQLHNSEYNVLAIWGSDSKLLVTDNENIYVAKLVN